jgi:hypothetical protein
MKKAKAPKVAGVPGTDPTMPRVEIVLSGESYFLAFNFRALALAQKHLRLIGYECNLLQALDLRNVDAEKFIPLLYAAMLTHHPEIAIDAVADLVSIDNFGMIFSKLVETYAASIAKPSAADVKAAKQDPTQPE